jgi:hypothetical protein
MVWLDAICRTSSTPVASIAGASAFWAESGQYILIPASSRWNFHALCAKFTHAGAQPHFGMRLSPAAATNGNGSETLLANPSAKGNGHVAAPAAAPKERFSAYVKASSDQLARPEGGRAGALQRELPPSAGFAVTAIQGYIWLTEVVMRTWNLLHSGAWGGAGTAHRSSGEWRTESDAWQKHVVTALWLIIALVVVLAGALFWAEAHGMFDGRTMPSPPVPTSWP